MQITLNGRPITIARATATHEQKDWPIARSIDGDDKTGWGILPKVGQAQQAVFELQGDLSFDKTNPVKVELVQNHGASHTAARIRFSATTAPGPIRAGQDIGPPREIRDIAAIPRAGRSEKQRNDLAAYYRGIAPLLAPQREKLTLLTHEKKAFEDAAPRTLISSAQQPRTMRVLPRGNWLDDSGEVVQPAVPAFLPDLDGHGRQASRLDLARWLVNGENPLVARVFVNRLWMLMFGRGLVATLDDFGSQGAWPTHPALLDWLAVEFVDSGWDVKHMVKLMVLSAAYRQSSHADDALREADPYNKWLARQGRFRLPAEMVRDNALAVSGLLSPKVGGPSVKPYQPAGYWSHLNFPKRVYHADQGEDQYRRGLYTYWCRTFLHPSLLAFDASTREECAVERPRSNTPLQALTLLNDPTFLEAARALAERILRDGGEDLPSRIEFAFWQTLQRPPRDTERTVLTDIYQRHAKQYAADHQAAAKFLNIGQRPAPKDLPPAELAAWTSAARVILNLHETITRY